MLAKQPKHRAAVAAAEKGRDSLSALYLNTTVECGAERNLTFFKFINIPS